MKKLLTPSVALTILAILLVSFQLTSCKNTDDQASNTPKVEGLWIGTYTVDGHPELGELYFSFIIKPGGTMIADTKGPEQHLSIGTWQLNGTTLSCKFNCVSGIPQNIGIVETSTATWDNKTKLTSGVWKNVPPQAGSGKFTLTKVG